MEQSILLFVQEYLRMPVLNKILTAITHLGDKGMIWILVSVLLLFFVKTRKTGVTCMLALLFSLILNNGILKNLVCRIRPYDLDPRIVPLIDRPKDYSFPSGHTGASFAAAYVLYKRLPRPAGTGAVILAALIAFSRIYIGVHYPTDVLFGAASGILCGALADWLMRRRNKGGGL